MASAKSTLGRPRRRDPRHDQGGFTLIELMIALTVLLIGVSGILSMHMTSMRATAYSRHATEASVLGEDKMEELRTIPVASIPVVFAPLDRVTIAPWGYQKVDAQGLDDPEGMYEVYWGILWEPLDPTLGTQTVIVDWKERGFEDHSIEFRTQRRQDL